MAAGGSRAGWRVGEGHSVHENFTAYAPKLRERRTIAPKARGLTAKAPTERSSCPRDQVPDFTA
jgi:hypothetical protein